MSRRTALLALLAASGLASMSRVASADLLGPTPYLQFTDSPFAGLPFATFVLEDFEDGAFNPIGATASPGWVVNTPGPFTDSVDLDDGVLDGSGTAGHAFYSASAQATLTITFDAAALGGRLPTHAGVAWTDVGNTTGTTGVGTVTFSALDALGNPLGTIGPVTLGDGAATGATPEDRFFGVTNLGGIASFTIAMSDSVDWEVDHIQFGVIVPEPSAAALLGIGLVVLAARRRSLGP